MSAVRVLHCGDLHPRMTGTYAGKLIVAPSGYSVAFDDFQQSLEALLAWENEQPCDLALIGGDIFDSNKPTPAECSAIYEFIKRLLARMSVICILGNHDMDVNAITATALHPMRSLGREHRDTRANATDGVNELFVMTTYEHALVRTAKGMVCVTGFPYPSKAWFKNSCEQPGMSPEEVMAAMNAGIQAMTRGLNETLHPTAPNIFLGHGTVSTAKVGAQPRPIAHDLMLPVDDLNEYDYVALNHVHKHQQVAPNAWYSGSLLCQDFGEKDEPKGWCVVNVERGELAQVTHVRNPHSRRFIDVSIDDLLLGSELYFLQFDPDGVYRIVGEVGDAMYPEAALAIAKFEQGHPFTQNAIDVIPVEDRSRDAGMTRTLSEAEAVERAVRALVPAESVSAVMEKHFGMNGGLHT